MRTIDTEHNWFWQQGYHDGLDGLRAVAPDETKHSFQRADYFAGYEAGRDDLAAAQEQAMVMTTSEIVAAVTRPGWRPPFMEPLEWLARIIARERHQCERDELSDTKWGLCIDYAYALLEQPDCPEVVPTKPPKRPTAGHL